MLLASQGHSYAAGRQAGGKSLPRMHRARMVNRSISVVRPAAPFDDGSDCRFRRAASIYWRLRRPARSSLPVSACNKAYPSRRLASCSRFDGFGRGGRVRRAGPRPPRNLFFIRRGKQMPVTLTRRGPGGHGQRLPLPPASSMLRYAATAHVPSRRAYVVLLATSTRGQRMQLP